MERAVLDHSLVNPSHGCLRVSQELIHKDIEVSSGGVRGVCGRHKLLTKHERLLRLEQKVSKSKPAVSKQVKQAA